MQIVATIYTEDENMLRSIDDVKNCISNIIEECDLNELGNFYHQFEEGGGLTGVIALVESHIALHTWPEFGIATLDVYLCNYSHDNTERCKEVFHKISSLFSPYSVSKQTITRGLSSKDVDRRTIGRGE